MMHKSNKSPVGDNWRIFIMAHNGVHDWMYAGDPDFSQANYTVVNLTKTPFAVSERYDLINQFDLPSSMAIGKWWTESEGILNIYKNGLHRSLDFVGFLHYDVALEHRSGILRRRHRNITRRIDDYLRGRKTAHISLETHRPAIDYSQRIMADVTQRIHCKVAG